MAENPIYYEDGVARVLSLLRQTFGDQFKAYFNGQAEDVAESLLPCIMVSETQGTVQSGATGTDDITESILIIVAMNRKDDMGAAEDVDLTEFKLRKIVKGQSQNGEYLPETIMYALRKHITMGDAVLQSRIDTNFDVNIRGENVVTQEAQVTVYLQRIALVPARDSGTP